VISSGESSLSVISPADQAKIDERARKLAARKVRNRLSAEASRKRVRDEMENLSARCEYLQDQVSYFQERLSKYEDVDVSIDKPTSRMIARHTSNRKSPKKLNSFIEPAAFFARPHRISLLVGV